MQLASSVTTALLLTSAAFAIPTPQTNGTQTGGNSTPASTTSNVATVNCQSEDIHCITSRGRRHDGDNIMTIPCLYADSTGSPNGLECDSYIVNSSGDQVGLTGNCGATTNQTPSFLVACRDVKLIQGQWVLTEQTYSSDALVKVSFDSLKKKDGTIGTYWQGEKGGPEIALRNLTSMSFHLNSLESAQKQVDWERSGYSFIPGVDVLLGCPESEDDDNMTTMPSTARKSTSGDTTTSNNTTGMSSLAQTSDSKTKKKEKQKQKDSKEGGGP